MFIHGLFVKVRFEVESIGKTKSGGLILVSFDKRACDASLNE